MSENVIRQDIIEVEFKTNSKALDKLNSDIDKFKKSVTGDVDKGIEKVKSSVDSLGKSNGVDKLVKDVNKLSQQTSRFTQTFQAANRSIQDGEAAIQKFKSSIKSIPTKAFSKISSDLNNVRMKTGLAVGSFKSMTKLKFNNLVADFKATKAALTEGEKGAQGFKNALSNIGKISISKAVSGFENIKGSIVKAKTHVQNFSARLKDLGNTKFGKVISGLSSVSAKVTALAKNAAGAAFNGLKKVAGISFKALTAGIGAAAAAIGTLASKAVSAYSDYEQLKGGMSTLLGAKEAKSVEEYAKLTGKSVQEVTGEYQKLKENEALVAKNANNAFKTAGMSANEYMDTITSFSAALKNSLGGDSVEAAKLADVAIQDMGDNVNKMGTDMESVSIVYSGLARGIYTTLDNLKLGYSGTKDGAKQLVNDAAKIDKSVKSNDLSYANLVKAIHAVQVETGIYGTTQREAEHTIQGSLNSLKAAWANMLPALIEGGDAFDQCIDNLVKSAGTFLKNIKPAILGALSGIGELIEEIAPILEKNIPTLVEELLPPTIKAATGIVKGLIVALPSIIQTLVAELPTIASELSSAIGDVFNTISQSGGSGVFGDIFGDIKNIIDDIIPTLSNLIQKIDDFLSKKETLDAIKDAWDGIKTAVNAVWFVVEPIITLIANNLDTLVPVILGVVGAFAVLKIAIAAVNFVMAASPITWIIVAIVALIAIIALCVKYWDNIKAAAVSCWNAIKGAWNSVCEWFNTTIIQPIKNFFVDLWTDIENTASSCWETIKGAWNSVCEWFNTTIIQPIVSAVQSVLNFFKTIGTWIYENVITPIVNFVKGCIKVILVIVLGIIGLICQALIKVASWVNDNVIKPVVTFFLSLWDKLKSVVQSIWETICTVWGLISGWVSDNVINPVVTFFLNLWDKLKSVVQSIWETICTVWGLISGWVNDNVINPVVTFFLNLWDKLKSVVQSIWETICTVWGLISGWVNDNVIQPISDFFQELWNKIKDIADGIKESLVNAFQTAWDKVTGVWDGLKKFFSGIWEGLKDTGESLKNTFVGIWKDAVKAIQKPVNKLIGGANWVLEKLGSKTRVEEWQPYAKGTNGHKGGNALVNDGNGAELVQMPNGNTFIPKGRNVFIPNAPKGMKVLPAEQTANLMGRKSPTFQYKDGTGFDIWSFFGKAKDLAGKVIEKFVSFKGMTGYVLDVGKAMISKTKGALSSWVSNLLDKFGGKDISSYVASKGVEQWRSTVIRALKMENLYSEDNVKRTLYQMQTESGGNPRAINLWDSNAKKGIPSKGLMQVIDPTFKAYARAGYDKNIYDPLSNILAAIRYAVARYGSLARAFQGHGYANGGIATKPSIFGEDGAEAAIPLSRSKRKRGLSLWEQTGSMLGVDLPSYSPDESGTGQSANVTEHNTYSPVFNLTISGTNDDRTMARKVKRWVNEAIEDTFDSYSRRNPKLKEV